MISHNNIQRVCILRIVVGITMLALLLAGGAGASTLTVNSSGGANYTRIQDAIDNANLGDTIEVYNGTYYENVTVNKRLILRGIGMPVVDAGIYRSAITLAADGIILEGFTAIAGYEEISAVYEGINVTSNNNILRGNNVTSIISGSVNIGIVLSSSSNNTLIGNNVYRNFGQHFGHGIILGSSNNNTLIGNNVVNNGGKYGYGISLAFSSDNMLINNTVNSNANLGITLSNSNNNTLIGNNALGNGRGGTMPGTGRGISLGSSSNNTLIGNNANQNIGDGISLESSSNNTISGNNALDNGYSWSLGTVGIGIVLHDSSKNTIYNNYFNNTKNAYDDGSNIWNTTKTSGTNIVGGSYLAGNFWGYPNGTGFSQTCSDVNSDGICDEPYVLDGNNVDHLPLSMNFGIDTISPANITNLTNITYAPIYINFTWTNPPDPDYHHVMLFLNGGYRTSVTAPQNHYNFTGLDPATLYELGTHTVDSSGNVNETWVNATVRTAPSELTTIQIMNPSANPAIILNDNGRARPPGTNITRLNVTVTGNVASVIIDLLPLGGLAKSLMTRISGTDIYSITTNATAGINLTNDLVVNVTDTSGNFNNSTGIPVTVLLRGDIVRDNKIDLKDLLYMRRHLAGLEPSINTFVADIQQAQGDGNVDLKDLLYLRRYLAGLEPLI